MLRWAAFVGGQACIGVDYPEYFHSFFSGFPLTLMKLFIF